MWNSGKYSNTRNRCSASCYKAKTCYSQVWNWQRIGMKNMSVIQMLHFKRNQGITLQKWERVQQNNTSTEMGRQRMQARAELNDHDTGTTRAFHFHRIPARPRPRDRHYRTTSFITSSPRPCSDCLPYIALCTTHLFGQQEMEQAFSH